MTDVNGSPTVRTDMGRRFREGYSDPELPAPDTRVGPSISDAFGVFGEAWTARRRSPRRTRSKAAKTAYTMGAVMVVGAGFIWFAGRHLNAVATSRATEALAAANKYTDETAWKITSEDGSFVATLDRMMDIKLQGGPTVLVSSNPLEIKVSPCVLTAEAKALIGVDPNTNGTTLNTETSNRLAAEVGSYMVAGSTPPQLRILLATDGSPAIGVDPNTGAPLASC